MIKKNIIFGYIWQLFICQLCIARRNRCTWSNPLFVYNPMFVLIWIQLEFKHNGLILIRIKNKLSSGNFKDQVSEFTLWEKKLKDG